MRTQKKTWLNMPITPIPNSERFGHSSHLWFIALPGNLVVFAGAVRRFDEVIVTKKVTIGQHLKGYYFVFF
jgi:hypothetical protein